MKNNDEVDVEHVDGDGSPEKAGTDLISVIKSELSDMAKADSFDVYGRRTESENTRYCYWDGQSTDGRKHSEDMDGKEAFPFEGASDMRIRLADMLVNERVMVLLQAVKRMTFQVSGMEISDMPRARKIETLFKWLIKNMLGSKWRRELKRLGQYQQGDSPAGAVMFVYWDQETGLEMQNIDINGLTQWLVSKFKNQLAQEDILNFVDMLKDPLQAEQAATFLAAYAPHLTKSRLQKVVKELRETGTAEIPVPYMKVNKPNVKAMRLFKDIYFPKDTSEYQKARLIAIPEWLTKAELEARQLTHGYSEDFVLGVLKHAGSSAFTDQENIIRVTGDSTTTGGTDIEANAKNFEVVTIYRRAINDDNVMCIRKIVIHHSLEIAAMDEEEMEYKHGEYPGVFFAREVLTDCLLDSRGIPEIALTDQSMQKLLADSGNDSAQLNTVPPVFVPYNRPQAALVIGPLSQIKRKKPTDYETMQVGQYPRANRDMLIEARRRIDEYFGRLSELVTPQLNVLHMQDMVDDFLTSLSEMMMQMFQLCQQYMPDEMLQRIVGGSGLPMDRSRAEIQGKFDLTLEFDVRHLDTEFLFKLAESMAKMILPMDTQATVQRGQLVQALFQMINPTLAETTLQPVEAVNEKEVSDEELNFTKISVGIEPPMQEQGQNHALRLQVLKNIVQKNPGALEKMDDLSKQILQNRVKHLQFMLTQQQNAQIGRAGTAQVLGGQQ